MQLRKKPTAYIPPVEVDIPKSTAGQQHVVVIAAISLAESSQEITAVQSPNPLPKWWP